MTDLKRISISLEESLLKEFDKQSKRDGYPTRSEAIKALMRQSFVEKHWRDNEEVAGTISIVYDHHQRGLANKVMHIQHHYGSVIVSTQHVHLDHNNCLEIVVVKGNAGLIQELASKIKSIKGIKHNELMMTTTKESIK